VRAALRVGEFTLARRTADVLLEEAAGDPEAATLAGDALWAAGVFDQSDRAYQRAHALDARSPRVLFGLARSLGSRSRLAEALERIDEALVLAPSDADLPALRGTVLERLGRFAEAADAYAAHAALLPSRESAAARVARDRADYLRTFGDRVPLQVSDESAREAHTVPFKLVNNKVLVVGRLNGVQVEWVLDTGAERTGVSPDIAAAARVRSGGTTLTAGVGRLGFRRIRLGRADRIDIGSLTVRNVPVSIRAPVVGGAPRWQGQSLSPIALGFSVRIDYAAKRLTLARVLPDDAAGAVTLPMRVQRLPLIRGTLNSTHPAYFVVDTGGEVISIGAETADQLGMPKGRRIPLRVLGMSGADDEAFLLPGVNLDFEGVSLRSVGVAVLNLRAPSVLLGFRVGGIVGHRFLSRYRVSIEVARSEVRLN
jgi:predicted aspartyl protease